MEQSETYSCMAQRTASSYLRFLIRSGEVIPVSGLTDEGSEMQAARNDLQDFFLAFYTALYDHPEQFGLPIVADDSFVEGESNGTAHKAELNKKLKKPRELIQAGLDFLMTAGRDGKMDGQALLAGEEAAALWKKSRSLKSFLNGLSAVGLSVNEAGGGVRLANTRYPVMMTALQALARACATYPEARLGVFHFARCDFRALQPNFIPDPLDLYRYFPAADFSRVEALHSYLTGMNYHATVLISSMFAWLVQYQGKRQIKATPFFQVEYQERYRNPVILMLKAASTPRIAPLIPHHSPALQDDFFRRVYTCRGAACGWCKNNKTLGPTTMERNGEPVEVCWYTNPVLASNDNTVALVKEYTEMHEELAG